MEKFAFSDTFVEITILNYLANRTHFKWIARDQDGCLCVFENKPCKEETNDNIGYVYWTRSDNESDFGSLDPFNNLFKFIKWEDEEPTLIKDALDKVEY